jgi:glycogen operon protein
MIAGGDEHLRSLNCNNNAYNLDSIGNWLSYSFTADQTNFATFAERMLAFRNAHQALRPQTWYSAADNNGNGGVTVTATGISSFRRLLPRKEMVMRNG